MDLIILLGALFLLCKWLWDNDIGVFGVWFR